MEGEPSDRPENSPAIERKPGVREHVLADLGVNFVEWHVLLRGWSVGAVRA